MPLKSLICTILLLSCALRRDMPKHRSPTCYRRSPQLRGWNYSLTDSIPVGITAQRENRSRQGSAAVASNLLDPDMERKKQSAEQMRETFASLCAGWQELGMEEFILEWRGE